MTEDSNLRVGSLPTAQWRLRLPEPAGEGAHCAGHGASGGVSGARLARGAAGCVRIPQKPTTPQHGGQPILRVGSQRQRSGGSASLSPQAKGRTVRGTGHQAECRERDRHTAQPGAFESRKNSPHLSIFRHPLTAKPPPRRDSTQNGTTGRNLVAMSASVPTKKSASTAEHPSLPCRWGCAGHCPTCQALGRREIQRLGDGLPLTQGGPSKLPFNGGH
jgi:hypothetical protein